MVCDDCGGIGQLVTGRRRRVRLTVVEHAADCPVLTAAVRRRWLPPEPDRLPETPRAVPFSPYGSDTRNWRQAETRAQAAS